MCELHPQWILTKDLTRKSANYSGRQFNFGSKEEVGKTIDEHDDCSHFSLSRLSNGNFYCHQCQKELKLSVINNAGR